MKLTRCRGLSHARPAVKLSLSAWLRRSTHQVSAIPFFKFSPAALTWKLFACGLGRHACRPSGNFTVPLLREDGNLEQSSPPPKGHLVVYVADYKDGGHSGAAVPRRYVVPVVYMNHPLFGELLREAVEEFGYDQPGGITIPCPVARFECVKDRIAASAGTHAGRRRSGIVRFGIKRPMDRR